MGTPSPPSALRRRGLATAGEGCRWSRVATPCRRVPSRDASPRRPGTRSRICCPSRRRPHQRAPPFDVWQPGFDQGCWRGGRVHGLLPIRFAADARAVRTRMIRRHGAEYVMGCAVGSKVPQAGHGCGLRLLSAALRAAARRWRAIASGPACSAKRRSLSAAMRRAAGDSRLLWPGPPPAGSGTPAARRARARALNSWRVRSSRMLVL